MHSTNKDEVFDLCLNRFNTKMRIWLWDSLIFPIGYFHKLVESFGVNPNSKDTLKLYKDFYNYDDYKHLHSLNNVEIKYLADIIIYDEIDSLLRTEEIF